MFGKKFIWVIWGLITVGLAAYYFYQFEVADDKSALLIGETSHGHFQIELACASCHTEPFGGPEILQNACMDCHADELKIADDTHPKSKFLDPRNADRVEILDARYCITCHSEHKGDETLTMGLTIPKDYCYHCHQDIFETRPSHEGMDFLTCGNSGCHNYHDNRALYEDFLIEHGTKPDLLATPQLPALQSAAPDKPLAIDAADAPLEKLDVALLADWHQSDHALKGVQCSDCHTRNSSSSLNNSSNSTINNSEWIEKPGLSECQTCHQDEVKGFTAGKHGMRLSSTLAKPMSPITPAQAKSDLAFTTDNANREHGCVTCHGAHSFDTQTAAANACLSCHADEHSLAFEASPHGALWQQELSGQRPAGTGVSCATCHLPREIHDDFGKQSVRVQHNQNDNLRPNEKMIRSVCMNCHGLSFSIDALADENLIRTNFAGKPSAHIPSVDMALEREQPRQ